MVSVLDCCAFLIHLFHSNVIFCLFQFFVRQFVNIDTDGNSLTGPLPSELGNLQTLEVLIVGKTIENDLNANGCAILCH